MLAVLMGENMTLYFKISEFFDMYFPGRWVWLDGPIPWPQRSYNIVTDSRKGGHCYLHGNEGSK
jgi:hypothetical protein